MGGNQTIAVALGLMVELGDVPPGSATDALFTAQAGAPIKSKKHSAVSGLRIMLGNRHCCTIWAEARPVIRSTGHGEVITPALPEPSDGPRTRACVQTF